MNTVNERHIQQQNRRLGLIIVVSLVVLYLLAIIGVLVLN